MALALTLAIEVPVVTIALASFGVARLRAAVLAVVANVITHPIFGIVVAGPADRWLGVLGVGLAEVGVVAVEAAIYAFGSRRLVRWSTAAAVALLANALSFAVGFVVLLVAS